MCKSQAEGGQRCAAHTRPAYENTPRTDPSWDDAAAAYASTPEGKERLEAEAEQARLAGLTRKHAQLRAALERGANIRDANADAAAAIRRADLTTWEPTDIDGELARLYEEAQTIRARRDSTYDHLSREVARSVLQRPGFRARASHAEVTAAVTEVLAAPAEDLTYRQRDLLALHQQVEAFDQQQDRVNQKMAPLNREFTRRGGWNRAFLVTGGTGHVHKDMHCSTCRTTTQYHWVTEMSDKDESEIVEAAGERACTVCFPSAPANVLNRPTRLFTPEERAQQTSRAQRATAAQERHAKKIANALTPDGSEFRVECTRNGYPVRERFKTERAATTWVVGNIANYRTWAGREMDASMNEAHERVIEAIAAKHDKPLAEVRADIEKKVTAKIRRDART